MPETSEVGGVVRDWLHLPQGLLDWQHKCLWVGGKRSPGGCPVGGAVGTALRGPGARGCLCQGTCVGLEAVIRLLGGVRVPSAWPRRK